MRMEATIKFDRPVKPSEHTISLGGFEMTLDTGKTVRFDFMDHLGFIKDADVVRFILLNLDTDAFDESSILRTFNGAVTGINEFFVYTGEDCDPEINPIELLELRLWNDNDEEITIKADYKTACVFNM